MVAAIPWQCVAAVKGKQRRTHIAEEVRCAADRDVRGAFHVPEPDEVILEERWSTGEWFRSGMVWKIGEGRVFYFRPGHETHPVFKEKPALQLLENAVRWLAAKPK